MLQVCVCVYAFGMLLLRGVGGRGPGGEGLEWRERVVSHVQLTEGRALPATQSGHAACPLSSSTIGGKLHQTCPPYCNKPYQLYCTHLPPPTFPCINTQDPRPMVRIITCWCLARYTQWVLLPPGGELTGQPGPVSPEAEVRGRLLIGS